VSPRRTTNGLPVTAYQVLGVLAVKGQSPIGQDQDDVVFVPYTTVMKKMRGIKELSVFFKRNAKRFVTFW